MGTVLHGFFSWFQQFTNLSCASSWITHSNARLSLRTIVQLCGSLFGHSHVTNFNCIPLRTSSPWPRLTFTPYLAVVHGRGSHPQRPDLVTLRLAGQNSEQLIPTSSMKLQPLENQSSNPGDKFVIAGEDQGLTHIWLQ
jgi:hypothetical protein